MSLTTGTAEPPEDRLCDLVMKGGITSGIVYPKAIALLAKFYRFKSIGGTSAGAVAAALTAAAEYQRRERDTRNGFEFLATLPERLAESIRNGRSTRLLSLFQPQPSTRRLFSVLVRSLNSGGTRRRVFWIVLGLLLAYWPATLVSLVVAVAVWIYGPGWCAASLLLILLLPGSIGCWVYFDITRGLVANGFGLCNGMSAKNAPHPAFTPWLHAELQNTAGRRVEDDPLTFGELWKTERFPDWLTTPRDKWRSIDLQMFTTNLSHGRPYIFPLPQDADEPASRFRSRDRLYFVPEELKAYLPENVVTFMVLRARPYEVAPGREGKDPDKIQGAGKYELPEAADIPVLFATRMSLSFPVLFSAVPLYAIDHDAPHGKREFRRCWFCDGGISSNFPMHLFDGLVPMWPTFGINLEDEIAQRSEIYLPKCYSEGYGERWARFAEILNPAARFGGYVLAMLNAVQNWNDNTLARMPGVRDRVARVRLSAGEGGLNLNMEAEVMLRIARRGERAAEELLAHFTADASTGPQKEGWDSHRLVRLSLLLNLLEQRAAGVVTALNVAPHATGYDELIARAATGNWSPECGSAPPGFEAPLTPTEKQTLHDATDALRRFLGTMHALRNVSLFRPIPRPELRVRPPL